MMGEAAASNFEMFGGSGFVRQAAAHAVHARADFVGGFVEVRAPREVQADVPDPSDAVELICSRPGTAASDCSSGRTMSCSISAGPTPP